MTQPVPEPGDEFGARLEVGDFNDDTYDDLAISVAFEDLAIGVPGQAIAGKSDAGKVVVVKGSVTGLTAAGVSSLSQLVVGSTAPEVGDVLGLSLAAGRLDPGIVSPWDLVVGVPNKDSSTTLNSGLVHLVFGSSGGLNGGQPDQTLEQKAGFAVSPPADLDRWGLEAAVGDLDGDGWGDLVVAAPGKSYGGLEAVGVVQVLFGALFADGFESGGAGNWSAISN